MGNKNDTVTIVCYGKKKTMTRQEAKAFYLACMYGSEGSERERYTNIYLDLVAGMDYCTDGVD